MSSECLKFRLFSYLIYLYAGTFFCFLDCTKTFLFLICYIGDLHSIIRTERLFSRYKKRKLKHYKNTIIIAFQFNLDTDAITPYK